MAAHIKIDIYQLQKDLNRLNESIKKMESTFNEMESSINNLKSKWTGEAADEFAYRTHHIEVKYWEALDKAKRLKSLANELSRKAVMKTRDLLNETTGQWKGDEATAFTRKSDIIVTDIDKMVRNIRNCASTIRRIAAQTMRAEKEAVLIAKRRAEAANNGLSGSW